MSSAMGFLFSLQCSQLAEELASGFVLNGVIAEATSNAKADDATDASTFLCVRMEEPCKGMHATLHGELQAVVHVGLLINASEAFHV